MYVCICHKISDKDIQESLNRGLSTKDILKRLNLGASCGTCLSAAIEDLQTHSKQPASSKNNLAKQKVTISS